MSEMSREELLWVKAIGINDVMELTNNEHD